MSKEVLERLSQEKEELDKKIAKLYKFRDDTNSGFRDLTNQHKDLLQQQLTTMNMYTAVLSERIRLLSL